MTENRKNISEPIAVATVVLAESPTSAKPGDKALIGENSIIDGWVGGGCAQPAVISASQDVSRTQHPQLIRVAPGGAWERVEGVEEFTSRCLSGGSLLIFIEALDDRATLCVFGASPVAITLATFASQLNFKVKLVSPEQPNASLPKQVELLNDYASAMGDYIVIATQGKGDLAALNAALSGKVEFVSIVASSRKQTALREKLAEAGMQESQMQRLRGPAGLKINAQTPGEIAVAILAEIIAEHRATSETQNVSIAAEGQSVSAKVVAGGCCAG